MKKTKAVKRKAAVILAAVIVFSSIGQCETLLAEEVSVSGADTVKTAESTENENSTEKTDTAEKEVVETENTEGSEMLECDTTENIGSTGTEETVETEMSAVEGQESTVATETEDVETECIETEMEDDLKAADIDNTISNATNISIGTEITGTLDSISDVDYFKFTTDGTDSFYTFSFSNIDISGGITYYIYSDENELNKIAYDRCSAKQTSTANLVKLEKNHTYYIKILNSEYNNGTGNYKFVIKKKKDDVADAVTSAKSLKLNETKKFALQNSKDVDCFKFTTTTYTNYTVNFTNVNSESAVYIRIYSGKDCLNNQLVLDKYLYKKQSLNSAYKELKLKTNKTYYVLISGSNIGNYKLGIDATGPASAIAKSASGKVTITWKKVTKATGYEVYRSVSRSGKYKKIKTIKKNSTVKYTDSKGLKKGKTYYYKVRAYKKSGKKTYYSAYSAVKSVKAK